MELRFVTNSESQSDLLRSESKFSVVSANSTFAADDERSITALLDSWELVTINVGGVRYQTYERTLARFPDSLLGSPKRRAEFYNNALQEYFFDRDRLAFDAILECYRSGRIVRSPLVPIHLFVRELLFYDLGDELVKDFLREEELLDEPVELPTNPNHRFFYDLLNTPESSFAAKIIAVLDILVVALAIVSMSISSLPEYQDFLFFPNGTVVEQSNAYVINSFTNPFFCIEIACNNWFLMDIIIRLVVAPNKRSFFCNFMVFADIVSILPFFLDLIVSYATNEVYNAGSIQFLVAFRILRLFRMFRIFKMDEYSDGLAVLTNTVKTAHRELGIMALFLITGMIFFGASIYYAERGVPITDYTSIPASFWWAVITWTTIGYGDAYPRTGSGKVVGCVCAVTGVLCLGLIIPPVVRRFEHFFYRVQNMKDIETVFKEHRIYILERRESIRRQSFAAAGIRNQN
ncbi:potassium voltage-gated channel subfamily A member 10-like [Paramacrobiotus metropolitanus]|uniref:potassium voltage-gated channel subfamily A member 10-like n=1 Tax=Paramacrobiotus metropolitanus TaxID=2943436 RepID=UPI00244621AA|nr:potassium voltage-gated channel subfamily A member 10-like [Paramacrobiotus metropolitanus]